MLGFVQIRLVLSGQAMTSCMAEIKAPCRPRLHKVARSDASKHLSECSTARIDKGACIICETSETLENMEILIANCNCHPEKVHVCGLVSLSLLHIL